MANYSLVTTSTFQPFTYQELVAPVAHQQQVLDNLAEQYDKLSSQADVLEAMGANDRDKNSGTYQRYKNYSDQLRAEADNLYRFGLNSESRQRLSDLRRMYNTEIVPIQNAWNKREQEATDQMKAQLANPSLMFTRDARNSNLDEYIKNPTGGYGVINGANITAQMSAMAKNLAEQILVQGRKEGIDDFTYNYISRHGLTPDMVRDWRNYPTLKNMFEQVMKANGVSPEALEGSVNAANIIDQSTGYAEMGMWNAIGKDTEHIQEDFYNRLMATNQAKIDEAVAKELAKHGIGDGAMPNIPSIAVGLTPTEEYKAKNLEILNGLKAGYDGLNAKYFGRDWGKVNPIKVYEEYQEELKKRTTPTLSYEQGQGRMKNVVDVGAARKAVLDKYGKYGVTDILSKDQYNALKDIGYSSTENISSNRHSALLQKFNESVEKRSRYSTNMTDYEAFNDKALPNLMTRGRYSNSVGTVWEIGKEGKIGKPETVKDLNLYSADNTKGNKVTDVQYDPEFKGKIVIQLSDGTVHVADPSIYDSNLTNMILEAERGVNGKPAPPQAITARIYDFLNKKNKVQGKTDSNLE